MNTVLITGANRGIGLELASQYADDGWRVLACCRNPEHADALQELAARHSQLHIETLDVANLAQIKHLAMTLAGESIDVLYNNAGIYPKSDRRGFGHVDYNEWMQAFQVNSMATLKMAESFIEQIARSEKKIIATISSKMGSIADNTSGGSYLYRSSKVAANMVVKSLALDLGPRGITAIVFHPGWVKTDMGGPNALIPVRQSVMGIRQVVAGLTAADSGKFLNFDGREIPW